MGCFNEFKIRKFSKIQTDVRSWETDQKYLQYLETKQGYKEWWDPLTPVEVIDFDDQFDRKEILASNVVTLAREAWDLFGISIPVTDFWLPNVLVYVNKIFEDDDPELPYVPLINHFYHPDCTDLDLVQQQHPKYSDIKKAFEGIITLDLALPLEVEKEYQIAERCIQECMK
jgi:hypothetical protein